MTEQEYLALMQEIAADPRRAETLTPEQQDALRARALEKNPDVATAPPPRAEKAVPGESTPDAAELVEAPPAKDKPDEAALGALVDETMAGMQAEIAAAAGGRPLGATAGEEQIIMADIWRQAAAREQRRYPNNPDRANNFTQGLEVLKDAAGTVRRHLSDIPKQVAGGARDAVQGLIDGFYDLGKWIESNPQIFGPTMRASAGLPPVGAKPALPEIGEGETATGHIARSVSHFLTGFAAGGPVVKGIGITGVTAQAMARGALADFAFFDGHEERLANLLEEIPALKNPVTAFMAAKPEDSEIEGRLKRAVEGLGLGVAAEGLFRGVRYLRDIKRAREAADPADVRQALARELAKPQEAGALSLLGDENAPALLITRKGPAPIEPGVPNDVAARALTPKGMTPLAESAKLQKSLHFNFAAINGPDDWKRAIADVQRAFWDDIDSLRGGVKSDKQLFAEAEATNAFDALIKRREGAPLADKEVIVVRSVWNASAGKLIELAENAARNPNVENEFMFRAMLEKHLWLQGEVMAARAASGRAQRAWGLPVGGGGAEKLMAMENLLNTYGGREGTAELAKQVALLAKIPGGLSKLPGIAEAGTMAKSVAAIKEVFINNILSSWESHAVNMLGNTAANLHTLIEIGVASRYSQLFGSGQIQIGEMAAAMFATKQGIREGLQMAWLALKKGESQFAVKTSKTGDAGFERVLQAKTFHLDPDDALGKAVDLLGAAVNVPTRLLTVEDDFFKQWAYRRAIDQRAFRKASREVQDGVLAKEQMGERIVFLQKNPPNDIHLEAINDAIYATFTNKAGKISGGINWLERKLSTNNASAGAQLAGLLLRYEIPFRNTIANLQQFAFERTPLAPLMTRYEEAIARGGADADMARTKMYLGSFVIAGLVDLAMDGYVTGSGPAYRDAGEKGTRASMTQSGWQPWSVWIPTGEGKGYYASYQRTDPLGKFLGLAATVAEVLHHAELDADKRESILKLVTAGAVMFGSQELDRGYLQGLSNLFGALMAPDPARQLVERPLASTVIPNWVTDIRKVQDPYMRYVSDLETELRNRIPGLSSGLPFARDRWGRPQPYKGIVPGPVKIIAWKPEPVEAEALKEDFNLMLPNRVLSAGGEKFKLNDAQYSRLLEIRGQLKPSQIGLDKFYRSRSDTGERFVERHGDVPLLQLLNDMIAGKHALSEAYAKMSGGRNGGKDKYITNQLIGRYQRAAAAKLFEEFPDLKSRVVRGKAILPYELQFEGEN
jgi:hypothetical protein